MFCHPQVSIRVLARNIIPSPSKIIIQLRVCDLEVKKSLTWYRFPIRWFQNSHLKRVGQKKLYCIPILKLLHNFFIYTLIVSHSSDRILSFFKVLASICICKRVRPMTQLLSHLDKQICIFLIRTWTRMAIMKAFLLENKRSWVVKGFEAHQSWPLCERPTQPYNHMPRWLKLSIQVPESAVIFQIF